MVGLKMNLLSNHSRSQDKVLNVGEVDLNRKVGFAESHDSDYIGSSDGVILEEGILHTDDE